MALTAIGPASEQVPRPARSGIIGDASPFAPSLVDLSVFTGVTRIEIAGITDAASLGYDDFTYSGSGVPEPATWAMMLLGFGAIGWRLRRRRNRLALSRTA